MNKTDYMVGQKINRLTILQEAPSQVLKNSTRARVLARCDCGLSEPEIFDLYRIKTEVIKSCKLCHNSYYKGQQFGHLILLKGCKKDPSFGYFKCVCGKIIKEKYLTIKKKGSIASCGCRDYEKYNKYFNEIEKHGFQILKGKEEYLNQYSPLLVKCQKHQYHVFWTSYSSLRETDFRCIYCSGYRKHPYDVYLLFKSKRYKLLDKYKDNNKEKLKYICLKHSGVIQSISYDEITHNRGCRFCGIEKSIKTSQLNQDEIINRLKENCLIFECFLGEYKNRRESKIQVHCSKNIQHKFSGTIDFLVGCKCPYCNGSLGEQLISLFLDELKINYIREKTFEECRNIKTGHLLKFDFFLPDYNICIEYQGQQHYKPIMYFSRSNSDKKVKISEKEAEENLIKAQERDQIKRDFCSKNNIKLIEIPYQYNTLQKVKRFLGEKDELFNVLSS